MESLNALLQGMGLMHLGAGQAIMLLVSLLLLWLAIAKKFEPLLLLPIGFGGLLSNIPEAGMALTSEKERKIRMVQLRTVSKREKILFPVVLLLLVALLLPDAAPLLGMFCFGNLMRESGVVERLSDTVQNGLINIVTIFLGLSVGAKLVADKFLQPQTLGILLLGVIAFGIGTAAGVLMAKLMNLCSKNKINPLIGSAGVSAVPMAARVSNKVGLESDPQNFLLMHAMGPNVAGVIGSAIAAGVMLKYVLAM
ncbi:sodium ion-translocating decarboxylase subunit beta [Salmonella enterica]|nr:sodium ion-translocating decarboxylase subunit beta [Salmonella enterica]